MKAGTAEGCSEHLVQGCPQVVQGISGDAFDLFRNRVNVEIPNGFGHLLIELGDQSIWARVEKGADCCFEVSDVGFGPSNLGECRV